MRAVLVDRTEGAVYTEAHPKPQPGPGEALVKVTCAGICNTDLEILKGYSGHTGVLGHEFLGTVAQVEDNPCVMVGQRVVGEINVVCEMCEVCQAGGTYKRNHCLKRQVLGILNKDGTFAEYLTLPIKNLFPVPEGVSDMAATFAEPLAAAFRIVEQELVNEGATVAVIGDGKLGLLITEVMNQQKLARLCLFGRHPDKMKLVSESIEKVQVCEDTGEKYANVFDVCIEASGSPSGIMMAASITRSMGTVVLKTTCAADSASFNTAPFVVKELTIVGSRCGNFDMALKALEKGVIQPEKLVTQVYPFSEVQQAIKHAGTRGTLKIQLEF